MGGSGPSQGGRAAVVPLERRLLMRFHGTSRRRIRAGLLAVAKAGVVACVTAVLLLPANAQFWTPWGGSSQQRSQQRQPQQGFNPFGGWFGSPPPARTRQGPPDYSRPPGPRPQAR